ncbi:hypothetical protein V6N11_018152 [Hibiscus sabdariffa]|uniref:Uncharacterized protein n=1 Tax=Hibiscus sabdariffa TaxID=183260 RepID=A0ABR2T7D0_9ROSI
MYSRLNIGLSNASVVDMIDERGCWRWHLFEKLLSYEVLLRIGTVKPPLGVSYDQLGWHPYSNKQFAVWSAFDARKRVTCGPFERI